MNRRFPFLLLVSVLIMVLMVLGLQAPASSSAPQLRLAISGDEGSLNPYTYVTGSPGFNLVQLLYDSLYRLDTENIPQPWLAKDVSIGGDGKIWTIRLHDSLQWHDGRPLTSADVAFTFDFVRSKEGTHSRYTSPSKVIEQVETPDERTVVFTLSKPVPSFALRPLADTPILPKHIWEGQKEPKKFGNSVGSGPYKLVEYKPDQFYRLESNKQYFQGTPSVDVLVIPIIKETTAMFTALKAGEVDAAGRALTPELFQQFKSDRALKVMQGPSLAATLLQINSERPPMDRQEFRQALDHAIDKQALVDTVLLGLGVPASPGFVHPSSAWANPNLTPRFDAPRARQLLDSIGLKDADGDGFREKAGGTKLDLTLLVYANNPLRVRAAEMIIENLKAVGIKATLKAMDPTSVDDLVWPEFDVAKGRNYDLAMWGWSAPIQVDPTRLRELVHSNPVLGNINIGGFKNAEADRIGDDLAATRDAAAQRSLSARLQEIIAEEVPFVTLWFPEEAYAFNPKVHDGWTYTKGQGIISSLSLMSAKGGEAVAPQASQSAAPTTEQKENRETEPPARTGNIWWLVGGAVALVAAFVITRRQLSR